jgi:hypothetical protein
MENEFEHLDDDEKLKAENEFMKMKMMLERGAQFNSAAGDKNLSPDIENSFLKHIMAFEQQFEERKTTTVFEKIQKPQHFRPVDEISDSLIDEAWDQLYDYMVEHGVQLDCCSPNISNRELYRFATEELFEHEMEDFDMPGMTSCFIYDEFHPDHVYDNERMAESEGIQAILSKKPLEWMHQFEETGVLFNQRKFKIEEFKSYVNRFKAIYDEIGETGVANCKAVINGNNCVVTGTYESTLVFEKTEKPIGGKWRIEIVFDDIIGYWHISKLEIEGVEFPTL